MRAKKMTLGSVVLGNLKHRRRANLLLMIGVTLAVVFLSVTLFGSGCLVASADRQNAVRYGNANIALFDVENVAWEELVETKILGEAAVQEILYACEMDNAEDTFTIARYSQDTQEMLNYTLLDGRMPQNPGEIAMESSLILKLRLQPELGGAIPMELLAFDGEGPAKEAREKTFTLVGILRPRGDRNRQWFSHPSGVGVGELNSTLHAFHNAPLALVAENEPAPEGGRAMQVAYAPYGQEYFTNDDGDLGYFPLRDWANGHGITQIFAEEDYANSSLLHMKFEHVDENSEMFAAIAAFVALTVAAMAGIANALTANIDRRKSQIGMLRAIGATQRQIRKILLRETMTIMLVTLPAGIALSLGILRLIGNGIGEMFVWNVPIWLVFADILGCAACIFVSSMAPVRRSAKITPMQAVRDIDITRMFLRKGQKSQENFVPQRLIAKRANGLRRGRVIGMTILLTAGTVLFAGVCTYCSMILVDYDVELSDYVLHDWEREPFDFGGTFVNAAYHDSNRITPEDAYLLRTNPYLVERRAESFLRVGLVVDEITDYATIGGYGNSGGYAGTEPYAHEKMYLAAGEDTGGDEWREEEHADYLHIKAQLGVQEDKELLETPLVTVDRQTLENIPPESVLSGRIDIEKLLSGEEVLVVAPDSVGLEYSAVIRENGISLSSSTHFNGILDDEPDWVRGYGVEYSDEIFTGWFENDMFRAGEMLEYIFVTSDAQGDKYRYGTLEELPEDAVVERRTVKIGAILDVGDGVPGSGMFIRVIGSQTLAPDAGLTNLRYDLREGIDEEAIPGVSATLQIVAERSGSYFTDNRQIAEDTRRTQGVVILVCALVCLLMFAFTDAMLISSFAGKIRSDIRQIGTMRAVGASRRVVFRAYMWQFYRVFWVGGTISFVLTVLINYYLFSKGRLWSFYLTRILPCIWTAPGYVLVMLLLCMLSVRSRLRPIFRASVVENIRML